MKMDENQYILFASKIYYLLRKQHSIPYFVESFKIKAKFLATIFNHLSFSGA
jgi:hypothetical protein